MAMPGRPARFTVTVKTSLRYISTGSAFGHLAQPEGGRGRGGRQDRVDTCGESLVEVALDQRADAAGAVVIGVVEPGREDIGARP
jgi:hypothetical protein